MDAITSSDLELRKLGWLFVPSAPSPFLPIPIRNLKVDDTLFYIRESGELHYGIFKNIEFWETERKGYVTINALRKHEHRFLCSFIPPENSEGYSLHLNREIDRFQIIGSKSAYLEKRAETIAREKFLDNLFESERSG